MTENSGLTKRKLALTLILALSLSAGMVRAEEPSAGSSVVSPSVVDYTWVPGTWLGKVGSWRSVSGEWEIFFQVAMVGNWIYGRNIAIAPWGTRYEGAFQAEVKSGGSLAVRLGPVEYNLKLDPVTKTIKGSYFNRTTGTLQEDILFSRVSG